MNINHHREAYNDMKRASQHVPYALPHGRTRVTRLLHSIETTETTIKSNPNKVEHFEEAVKFLQLCSPTSKSREYYFQ